MGVVFMLGVFWFGVIIGLLTMALIHQAKLNHLEEERERLEFELRVRTEDVLAQRTLEGDVAERLASGRWGVAGEARGTAEFNG